MTPLMIRLPRISNSKTAQVDKVKCKKHDATHLKMLTFTSDFWIGLVLKF